MDVIFDAAAAEALIRQMDQYCLSIQKDARDLIDILRNPAGWQDNQLRAFQENINELAKNLNQALSLESEYMRTFHQRVQELRR